MTFDEKFNIPENTDYNTRYDIIIDNLGYNLVKTLVPVSKQTIIESLKTDPYLNNISITKWDNAAGFKMIINQTRSMIPVYTSNNHLCKLCAEKGVTSFSPAELVCILKRCAVRMASE